MSDWTAGYVAEIGYTFGYYKELNPNRSNLVFLNAGFETPTAGVHCELGYGQGLSVNVHSAASGNTWHGTDFNPAQAAFAKSLAAASGADAYLTDEAFVDFCNRGDLPDFDSIGLHGIWSWISDENRAVIVDFIRRKLKVGGALYISYNTLPGWASFAPIRHLMTEHANNMGSQGKGVVSRVDDALVFAQKLLDADPLFSRANPRVSERLKKIATQDRHYLAHEYFNKDWHPMHFATMSQWLSPAKISFVCSANYIDQIDAINLTAKQQVLLQEIADPTFKETVRDFMVNQQFRRDYWIKGARKISQLEKNERINKEKVLLISPQEAVSLKINGPIGEVNLNEKIYMPVLDLMSDHKIRSIGEIASCVKSKSISNSQVIQAIMVLIGAGHVDSVQPNEQISKAKTKVTALNNTLLNQSRFSTDASCLASPVTGGGIVVNRIQQLFLLALKQGKKQPKEWANSAWEILSSQNQRLTKDGKALLSPEDNLKELTNQAFTFESKRLTVLNSLKIV